MEVIQKQPEIEEVFSSFLFIIIQTIPNKSMVRITLDDGLISFLLKNQKFLSIFHEILLSKTPSIELFKNYKKIEAICNTREQWLYYDRSNNILKEIGFQPDFTKITPKDLYANTTQSSDYLQQKENEKRLQDLRMKYEEKVLKMKSIASQKVRRPYYNNVMRSI